MRTIRGAILILPVLALLPGKANAQATLGGVSLYPWNSIYNQRIDHRTGYDDITLASNSTTLIDLLDGDGTRTLGFSVISADTASATFPCPSCVGGYMPVAYSYPATWTWVTFDSLEIGTSCTTGQCADHGSTCWTTAGDGCDSLRHHESLERSGRLSLEVGYALGARDREQRPAYDLGVRDRLQDLRGLQGLVEE